MRMQEIDIIDTEIDNCKITLVGAWDEQPVELPVSKQVLGAFYSGETNEELLTRVDQATLLDLIRSDTWIRYQSERALTGFLVDVRKKLIAAAEQAHANTPLIVNKTTAYKAGFAEALYTARMEIVQVITDFLNAEAAKKEHATQ